MTLTAAPATEAPIETPAPVPVESPKPLKLSEAMRLGSLVTKQAFNSWHSVDERGEDMMCALSTAWYALTGHKSPSAVDSELVRLLDGRLVEHPVRRENYGLSEVIIDLNDRSRWSRTQIADWLESIGL